MSTGDDRPGVTGETTITLFDQVKAAYWSAPWVWWAMVACILFIYLPSLWGGRGDDDDSFFSSGTIFACLIVLWAGIIGFCYWRLGREQKHLRYHIDAERIEFSDGTGAVAAIPWAIVRRAKEARTAFLLRVRPAGLRWLPKRAFTADGVTTLRGIIAKRLGVKAKLHQ